ncbi:MAG: MarR family transcriptional regulator [Bacteroidota bacterium]
MNPPNRPGSSLSRTGPFSRQLDAALPAETEALRHEAVRAWASLVRTYGLINRRLTSDMRDIGLSMAQMDVLVTLHYHPGLSQTELAERLYVTKGNVTGLVKRMLEGAWLKRVESREDGRTKLLYLTEAGHAKAQEAVKVHERLISVTTSDLTTDQLVDLRDTLRVLRTPVTEG